MHHAALSVYAMAESVHFYGLFGFREVVRYREPDGTSEIAHLKLGDAFLELWWYAGHQAAPKSAENLATDLPRIGWKHLALRVESLTDAIRLLEDHQIPLAVPLTSGKTGVTYLFVRDPSGNLLEILEDDRDV